MNGPDDNSTAGGLRKWWFYPPRPGLQRLINPWEYRHLRFSGAIRIFGGCIAAGAGIICLGYSAWGWATFFLVLGALNLAGGGWYLSIDGSGAAGT
ncbi:MAG: hypothetical protein JO016_11990 [Actinobacteria bacterium]|nr:hypothetical protein [Actinomycetota bacterium]